MSLKLGKTPARQDSNDLRMVRYLTGPLPKPPRVFGHEALITSWGMLGNDRYGDCVWAGAAHETMLWNVAAGHRPGPRFTDDAVLSDYAAATGFDPRDRQTDQGTDMREAMGYRRTKGVVDADGRRHTIGAYVALEPGNLDQLKLACYLFGAVAVGVEFPSSAMDQFNAGRAWSVKRGSQIEGGHYIPVVAWRGRPVCVTWGRLQPMTSAFYQHYCDEAFVALSSELLDHQGKSPEGFDLNALTSDLQRVTGA